MKTIEVEKKNNDIEVILFEKMKLDITEEDAQRLMWKLADILGYENIW